MATTERTGFLQIRVSDSEKRLIRECAKRDGMPMSTWIRLVLMNANLRVLLETEPSLNKKRRKVHS